MLGSLAHLKILHLTPAQSPLWRENKNMCDSEGNLINLFATDKRILGKDICDILLEVRHPKVNIAHCG